MSKYSQIDNEHRILRVDIHRISFNKKRFLFLRERGVAGCTSWLAMAEIQGEEADQKFMKRGEEQKDEDITDRIEIEGEEGEVDKEHGEAEGEEGEEEEDDEVTKRVKARMMMKDYNPLETMMSAFQQSSSSAQIELKQRLPDGSYQPAPNGTMEAIGSQAKIAATASVIANMTKEEKTKWAIDKRNEGNQSYLRKEFEGAIQIYLEVSSHPLSLFLSFLISFSHF
jgi:hypothetical protein